MPLKEKIKILIWCLLCVAFLAVSYFVGWQLLLNPPYEQVSLDTLPQFSGEPYIVLNGNLPNFVNSEITSDSFEYYSDLDIYNRCGYAIACVGRDIMPHDPRGSIGQVKPSGWQTIKYDFVDGKYLYNRCHLIGYQLTGENSNPCNLITGTRYLNMEGMLPFENKVADYVQETGNHVMYRVTPVFYGDEMVARGVQMEGLSVEDHGAGICFNIYAYNNQPGVIIDYTTGESFLDTGGNVGSEETPSGAVLYIFNTASMKFHLATCLQGENIKWENKQYYNGNRWELIARGYVPAGCCNP